MDFNLNDEQELFVAGIRELMASENWEAYFAECDRDSVYTCTCHNGRARNRYPRRPRY